MSANDPIPNLASLRRGTKARVPREHAPTLFDGLFPPELANAALPLTHEVIDTSNALPPDLTLEAPARSHTVEATALLDTPLSVSTATTSAAQASARIWTVGQLVREVRGLVEKNYQQITIDGEVSNWRPAASGHCYFTLKDGIAQLSVVMFRKQATLLHFKPRDGSAVRIRGQVSVFESRGQMQLIAESMQEVGQGALLAAVQRLKERLRAEGLFDRKRPLPVFPRCIGVITSLHGAALRDIVKVCRRRHAAVNLLLYPVAVQGPRCAVEVTAALRWFSAHAAHADVVLVARGGGSWEDLHGFDDEAVARAIAGCALPVISGIGHATDSTIADAAADLCAPTPSAAAELVTAAHFRIDDRVQRLAARLERAGRYELLRARQRFLHANAEAALRRWHDGLRAREQRLDDLAYRAENAMQRRLRQHRERWSLLRARLERQAPAVRFAEQRRSADALEHRLRRAWTAATHTRVQHAQILATRLDALSPLRVLERGYALVYGPDGRLLRSTNAIVPYDMVTARVAKGTLRARVTEKIS